MRFGVLVSGSGSNLQAILDAEKRGELGPGKIAVVLSNVPSALALERAARAGVPTEIVDHKVVRDRAVFDQALVAALGKHDVDWVVLAGFMRLVGAGFLQAFGGRVVNIHPALLPAFPGMHGARQALEYGVRIAGCTVHFVDEGCDTGPIIAQRAVAVHEGDDEAALQARIQVEEHRLFPAVLRAIADGRVSRQGRRVAITGDVLRFGHVD